MSNTESTSSPAATPQVRQAQRWNIVWVVPIVALLIGAWMIYRNFSSQGPIAQVRFETADGIAADKTEVRCRSVRVGVVKDVKLAEDLNSVVVTLELTPDSDGLLRNGTNFWVVRPRVSATDISGLGTLITGAYIELDPGPLDGLEINHFNGAEIPPATNRNIPGRRLKLIANEAGSLTVGSPVFYRGFEVGRIESRTLDRAGSGVSYEAFIQDKYRDLVKKNSRFWNTSGIDISAGADGFKLRTPSFQAMLSGGATFGVGDGIEPSDAAEDGTTFTLFNSENEANEFAFNSTIKVVLLFDQSVRGLVKTAPVEFRGIPIGRVNDISFEYLKEPNDLRIPVLIEIDPKLLRRGAGTALDKMDGDFLSEEVQRGLRATLKIGSILTGSLFVDLDYYKNLQAATLIKVGNYDSIPTISSGLAQLESKLTAILDKIQALPFDDTMKKFGVAADETSVTLAESRKALKEIQEATAAARKMMDSSEFANLPKDMKKTLGSLEKSVASMGPDGAIQSDLLRTLEELRAALRSMNAVATSIDEKPNSLLFGRESSGNPIPKAPKAKR
ncbi:MAG: intermembrane transport protein PqiB [Akkermansiaceae bacterium]|nr:intermembrane transport protein PqiB [Akkermansiaceae bacterium]